MSTNNVETFTSAVVPRNQIEMNPENPREFDEKNEKDVAALKSLAASIKKDGIEQPPIIRSIASKDGPMYRLMDGERRLRAMDSLGWTEIPVRIDAIQRTDKDAYRAAVIANVERKDFTTYELANAAAYGVKKYNMSGTEAGAMVGAKTSYANQLIRAINNLHPRILDAWKLGHPLATVGNLNDLASITDKDEQVERWTALLEGREEGDEEPTDTAGGGGGNGAETERKTFAAIPTRKVMQNLESLINVLRKQARDAEEQGEKDMYNFTTACIQFAIGKRKTAPISIKEEKAAPEGEAEAKRAKRKRGQVANV